MNKEAFNDLLKKLKEDFGGDVDKFLEHLKSELLLELQTRNKAQKEKKAVSGNPIVKLNKVSKEFQVGQEKVYALSEVDLEVYSGEILALVGTSGSGKSTLLNLIGGLDVPTSGEITVNGANLKLMKDQDLSNYRNHTIGFIFQFFNLQPYLTVQENVEIPLIFRGETEEKRNLISAKVIDAVGLKDRINHLPNQLSGGQMQRVAIARSLVNQPKLILADEPTGNLDRKTGLTIIDLLKKINKEFGTTIVIVTHDSFVANEADRIVNLSDGRII